ncbi:MAG TPA: sigma-54 dependent transcriptional regulator [bacterium]|nr:sigma-54 dependent transcriptional regulator [bacterium]
MIFRPAILYVDDEQANLETFKRAFGQDYLVRTCASAKEALDVLEAGEEEFPILVADQRMPGLTGIELCEKLSALRPQMVRMILTAFKETQMLLDAINRGRVHDYIVKPWKKSELKPIFDKAFEDYKQKVAKIKELEARAAEADVLEEEVRQVYDSGAILGETTGLKSLMEKIKKAAPTDSTILLLGETGTGKELLARAVHDSGGRKSAPFVPVHCAALVETLLESELFGHEKGAFTGADKTRIGRFETASGGTIFLDEIGEIPESIQVKLLRVLQEKMVQRVGGNRSIPVDVRVVAATHRNLEQMVKDGRFREDLFYRLNVIALKVPALRDRREDIAPLADHFVKKYAAREARQVSLSPKAVESLRSYDWPGNIRELQNVLERAVILSVSETIEPEDLNLNHEEVLKVDKVDPAKLPAAGSLRDEIRAKEMETLKASLVQANGNVAEAARLMGVPRTTLFHRLKKYRLV